MRSVISISDLCWDMSAFTSEYVSLMMARNMFYIERERNVVRVILNNMNNNRCDCPTHHENKENEEDKGGEVDRSEHWIRLLYF